MTDVLTDRLANGITYLMGVGATFFKSFKEVAISEFERGGGGSKGLTNVFAFATTVGIGAVKKSKEIKQHLMNMYYKIKAEIDPAEKTRQERKARAEACDEKIKTATDLKKEGKEVPPEMELTNVDRNDLAYEAIKNPTYVKGYIRAAMHAIKNREKFRDHFDLHVVDPFLRNLLTHCGLELSEIRLMTMYTGTDEHGGYEKLRFAEHYLKDHYNIEVDLLGFYDELLRSYATSLIANVRENIIEKSDDPDKPTASLKPLPSYKDYKDTEETMRESEMLSRLVKNVKDGREREELEYERKEQQRRAKEKQQKSNNSFDFTSKPFESRLPQYDFGPAPDMSTQFSPYGQDMFTDDEPSQFAKPSSYPDEDFELGYEVAEMIKDFMELDEIDNAESDVYYEAKRSPHDYPMDEVEKIFGTRRTEENTYQRPANVHPNTTFSYYGGGPEEDMNIRLVVKETVNQCNDEILYGPSDEPRPVLDVSDPTKYIKKEPYMRNGRMVQPLIKRVGKIY